VLEAAVEFQVPERRLQISPMSIIMLANSIKTMCLPIRDLQADLLRLPPSIITTNNNQITAKENVMTMEFVLRELRLSLHPPTIIVSQMRTYSSMHNRQQTVRVSVCLLSFSLCFVQTFPISFFFVYFFLFVYSN
jgi:hypothetical protein